MILITVASLILAMLRKNKCRGIIISTEWPNDSSIMYAVDTCVFLLTSSTYWYLLCSKGSLFKLRIRDLIYYLKQIN